MGVRFARLDDVPQILKFIEPYHEESMFNGWRKLDWDTMHETIYMCVASDWEVLLAVDGENIAGILIAYASKSFYKHPDMDVDFFYVGKEYRGTKAARLLVAEIVKIAKQQNITMLYCGCHSNMADGGLNDKLYVNLFRKFGFEVTGTNLHLTLGE